MFSVVLFPQAYLRGRCISKSKIAVEVWVIGRLDLSTLQRYGDRNTKSPYIGAIIGAIIGTI